MYPFNTAAMDIDASLLVYLVGGLSCFPLFSFLFPPFFVVLKLLKSSGQAIHRLPAEEVERS